MDGTTLIDVISGDCWVFNNLDHGKLARFLIVFNSVTHQFGAVGRAIQFHSRVGYLEIQATGNRTLEIGE